MKKMLCLSLAVLMLAWMLPLGVMAAEDNTTSVSYYYCEDGSYIKITVIESSARIIQTKAGSKTYEYFTSDGERCWKAVISGTFMYNGNSATCTDSGCNVTIYDASVSVVSKTTGKESNCAYATLVMGKEVLGVSVIKTTYELKITCDKDGNLS